MSEDNIEIFPTHKQDSPDELLKKYNGSHALAKACYDPFDYALKLRTGEVIRFESARLISPEWIHIELRPEDQIVEKRVPYIADRGIDIRIADIVWVMDAPMGS